MASEALSRPSGGVAAAKRRERRMDGNVSIGRFGGVEVRLNWSLIAVVALIVWSLTDGVFPSQNPGLSHGTYLAMAIVAAVLFLASILLHELGHSWVARHEGIEVDSITLWLFGGVSQFKGRYGSPGAEFRVAFTGPLVSIVLGAVFVLIALAGFPSEVDGVAAWLGYINLILAVFNLIPAAPLDGGRVLHAALWRAKGDFAWANPGLVGDRPGLRLLVDRARARNVHLPGLVQRRMARLRRLVLAAEREGGGSLCRDGAGARRLARSRPDGA
jgi:Zn-dependent protease